MNNKIPLVDIKTAEINNDKKQTSTKWQDFLFTTSIVFMFILFPFMFIIGELTDFIVDIYYWAKMKIFNLTHKKDKRYVVAK